MDGSIGMAAGDPTDKLARHGMELPRRIDKPWGHEIWWALTDRYAGKLLHIEAGHRLSLQYHETKDETSYLYSGRLRLSRGEDADALDAVEVGPGGVWRNTAGVIHMVEAIEDCVVLEVSTPELDDVVRLEDSYGRAGTNEH
jgi:mannose-6-phosphate isomerase-like protein (cupin superfamily)